MRSVTTFDLQYAHRFYGFKGEAQYLHGHTGTLTIEDTIFDNYILNSTEDTANNVKVWTTDRKEEAFGDFYWKDEDNRVIPEDGGQGLFYGNSVSTITYINDIGQEYEPGDVVSDFKFTLTILD